MFSSLRSPITSSSKADTNPFSSIISTQSDRQEFTLLVLLCTNHMRTNLAAAFSPSHTSSRPSIPVRKTSDIPDTLPPSYGEATNGRGRQDYDRRNEELASHESQELRRQALSTMNAWRTKVLRRMGEVLDVRSEAVLAEKARRDAINGETSASDSNHQFHPNVPTILTKLDQDQRETLLSSLLLLLLSLETYSAYSRVLLCHVCHNLKLPQQSLSSQESTTANGLLTAAQSMNADKETAAAANSNATGRAWKIGLATVGGAVLVGVTGGLAAPFLAAGVGGIFGAIGLGGTAAAGLLGGLAGNAVLIGGLFGAYGGRMTGGLMEKYAAEISDFAFIPRTQQEEGSQHHLRIGITISGWLTTESEVTSPWNVILPTAMETFALRWELSLLLELGTSLAAVAKSAVWEYAKMEILKQTVLSTLAAGLWPLGLVRVASIADNPFSLSLVRADKAGELLADALINRAQGERPVNLIGYSMGARVIYSCLQSLARRKAFGLVESAVLIGAPCPSDAADWRTIRSVCVGRVINVYSTNDFILAFLYRSSTIQFGVAGVEAIEEVAGVESWDASIWVSGHTRYRHLIGRVLEEIGFEGLDDEEIGREAQRLKQLDESEVYQKTKLSTTNSNEFPRYQSKEHEENLINFDEDDDNNKDVKSGQASARELTDQDIQSRIQDMKLSDQHQKENRRDILGLLDEEDVPTPKLPPRRQPASGSTRIEQEGQKHNGGSRRSGMQAIMPEPMPVSDDESPSVRGGVEEHEESDYDDDPFANRGIRMIDTEHESVVENEAERGPFS